MENKDTFLKECESLQNEIEVLKKLDDELEVLGCDINSPVCEEIVVLHNSLCQEVKAFQEAWLASPIFNH